MDRTRSFNAALVRTILESCVEPVPSPLVDQASAFVEAQVAALPPHVGLAVRASGRLIAALARVQVRGPLAGADRAARHAALAAWDASPVSPVRQYCRLVRALTLFAAYESIFGAEVTRQWQGPAPTAAGA